MSALRQLRRDADLSQRDLAGLLDVPLNTLRMWDSGLRPVPARMLLRARAAVGHRAHQTELLPLAELAKEFRVHVRTLQAAVRTGRLAAHFSVKSVFGRPRRMETFGRLFGVNTDRVTHDLAKAAAEQLEACEVLPTNPPSGAFKLRMKVGGDWYAMAND